METRKVIYPEVIAIPHHELSYDDANRKDCLDWKVEDFAGFSKQDAVDYARTAGFKETGMSPNEVGLIYDLLLRKRPRHIVELGRNFGVSTRIFLWYCVTFGGYLESWDIKHWGESPKSLREVLEANGFTTKDDNILHDPSEGIYEPTSGYYVFWKGQEIGHMKIANSMKTPIHYDRKVDFLLIDTEHGLENALGEYMRWRMYMNGGGVAAFHDSELPAVHRAIEIAIEVESDFDGRIQRHWVNERKDGFGIEALEWKG